MKASFKLLIFSVWLLLVPRPGFAIVIDFETLLDLEVVTTQFGASGVVFGNATALTSGAVGGSLNELEFPPRSGVNVVVDDGGPLTLLFGSPFLDAGGFFNYSVPITLRAFDPSDNLVGTVTSAFASNLALSGALGSVPNEFLQLAGVGPIARLEIAGDPLGLSFTLDDFTGTPQLAVSEPSTLLLLFAGLGGLLRLRKSL